MSSVAVRTSGTFWFQFTTLNIVCRGGKKGGEKKIFSSVIDLFALSNDSIENAVLRGKPAPKKQQQQHSLTARASDAHQLQARLQSPARRWPDYGRPAKDSGRHRRVRLRWAGGCCFWMSVQWVGKHVQKYLFSNLQTLLEAKLCLLWFGKEKCLFWGFEVLFHSK